tara:strand:+ start:4496 stop:5863 length:1368 start_codon:yes stop_codon:yes gene_type:complete
MLVKILNIKYLILLLSLAFLFFIIDVLNTDSDITIVNTISIDGPIKLNTANYIERIILENQNSNNIIVLILNTPGGSYEATRKIIELILASKVPIITYVSPSGGQAASAGTFIMAASHISAMSPFTSLGSATPVDIDGEDLPKTLENKISKDASALIRELAKARNKNIELFESTIQQTASFNSNEALESNMIDYISNDLNALLDSINGEQVTLGSNSQFIINTDNFVIINKNMNLNEKIIDFISNPNITFLFLTLGALLIFIEILIPGTIVSGVFGIILLILAFIGLNNLPVNYFAVILIILALVLIYIEFSIAGFGIVGIMAIFSFVFGAIVLFGNNSITFLPNNIESTVFMGFNVNFWIIFILSIIFTSFFFYLIYDIRKSEKQKKRYNFNILNQIGITTSELNPNGFIYLNDEIWSAESYDLTNIPINTSVRVKAIDDLILKVYINSKNDKI